MKHIFALFTLAAIFAFGTAHAQTASNTNTPKKVKQMTAAKVTKSNHSSVNILIHSIAFQKYNRVKYAFIPAKNFSVKKMMDTPDTLMPITAPTNDYCSVTTAYAGK